MLRPLWSLPDIHCRYLAGMVGPASPPTPAPSCFSTVQPPTLSPKRCTNLLFQSNRFWAPLSLTATPLLGTVLESYLLSSMSASILILGQAGAPSQQERMLCRALYIHAPTTLGGDAVPSRCDRRNPRLRGVT